MNVNQLPAYCLQLSDGASWNIIAEGPKSVPFVQMIGEVMQLNSPNGAGRILSVEIFMGNGSNKEGGTCGEFLKSLFAEALADYPWDEDCYPLKRNITCNINLDTNGANEMVQFIKLASIFALDVITRGGMLFHGALVEQDGNGVIFAGPGGAGKTTATNRLPENWRCLSDDATLIVRDEKGGYWGHPWPTWSRFLVENVGGKWDVGRGVKLNAVCFLSKSSEIDLGTLGEGELVCLGVEAVEQASRVLSSELDANNTRKLRSIYFRNISQLVKSVPGFQLSLNLNDPFWELIEERLVFDNP